MNWGTFGISRLWSFRESSNTVGGFQNPKNYAILQKGRLQMYNPMEVGAINEVDNKEYEKSCNEEIDNGVLAKKTFYCFETNKIKNCSYDIYGVSMGFDIIKDIVIKEIMRNIFFSADDFRKDFQCAYNKEHHCFVEFSIFPAVKEKPEEVISFENRKKEDENAVMYSKEKEANDLYNRLRYCLIAKKTAQYPSMAGMQLFGLEKYKKVLDKNDYRNFTMGMGLFASGVGIGSFVYLRRIFENIVEEFHQQCLKDVSDWDEDCYGKLRFNEKIDLIENTKKIKIFPPELNSIKNKLYGVLSQGVHSSSEEDCKELFPYMKFALEMLLDQKVAEKVRLQRIDELNKKIQSYK